MLSQWIFATYNGFAMAMAVFLVAAGLTWVFGILKILNMAHGHFFMVGAYVASSIFTRNADSVWAYLGAAVAAAVVVGLLGWITDQVLFRRLRQVDHHYVLIGTFALLIFVEGLVKLVWGADVSSVSAPAALRGVIQIGGVVVPVFTGVVVVSGLLVFLLLDLVIHRTWTGKLMQSLASDPWMAGMLGINVPVLLTVSVVASFVLAGLAGGLLLPMQSLQLGLGGAYLLPAFFAVIIGGLGNIRGAFIASVLLGLVGSFNALLLPSLPGVAIYVALAVFLIAWPNGIFPPVSTR
ncbi:MAG: branched-chain amino acid ABC transporter permease [Burkholderiales bacterium]